MEKTVAVVTGSNGRIGQETLKALREQGHTVVGVDVAAEPLTDGPYIQADLADVAALPALMAQIEAQHGIVRILVNNAGVWDGKHFLDITPDSHDLTMAVNLRAPFFLIQAFARRIQKVGGGGAVVNTSSYSAKDPSLVLDYSASKAALGNLTRGLRKPLGKLGIRINAVAPMFVNSAMTERVTPQKRREMEAAAVLGRAGEAAEVAAVIAFLVSDKASYMTGTTVEVDGGA